MKAFKYVLLAGLVGFCGIYATRKEKTEAPQIAETFSLKNNSKQSITFKLIQDSINIFGTTASNDNEMIVKPSGVITDNRLDISKPTQIELSYCKSGETCPESNEQELKTMPYTMIVTFPAGKIIYIKWDGKTIKPQEGKRGKSSADHRLDNNVTKKDIIIEELVKLPDTGGLLR